MIKKVAKHLLANELLLAGCSIIAIMLFIAIVSLFWTPHDPYFMQTQTGQNFKMLPPSFTYPLGTDHLGRCVLSRVMVASSVAFFIGFSTVVISGVFGVCLGLFSGYFGGIVDELIMRFVDIFMSIPSILFLLLFVAIFGSGTTQTIVAISLLNFTTFAKMVRSKVVSIKEQDYILWAKNVGVSHGRILIQHILPELYPLLLLICAMKFSGAVMAEAGLSYLGLGITQPNPSLGNMLTRAQNSITTNVFDAVVPGLFITAMVVGFNLIADGLKKEINVHERSA